MRFSFFICFLLILVNNVILKTLRDLVNSKGCYMQAFSNQYSYDNSDIWNTFYPEEDLGEQNDIKLDTISHCTDLVSLQSAGKTNRTFVMHDSECFQTIHANVHIPYFCALPEQCGKVQYFDLTQASFLGSKLVLCYGELSVRQVTTVLDMYTFSFLKSKDYDCDMFQMSRFFYIAHSDTIGRQSFVPRFCQDLGSSFKLGNPIYSYEDPYVVASFAVNIPAEQFCPPMFFASYDHHFAYPVLMKSYKSIIKKAPKTDLRCISVCDYNQPFVVLPELYSYFPESKDNIFRHCSIPPPKLPTTIYRYKFHPQDTFVTFFDVLSVFLSNFYALLAKLILQSSLFILHNFFIIVVNFGLFELILLFPIYFYYFRDMYLVLIIFIILYALRIGLFTF
nr:MAG: hypothetical protein [Drosophila River Almond nege-like virus]